MIEAIRAALAAIPTWVWPTLVGATLVADGVWSVGHIRQLQEDQLRAWSGPVDEQRARFLRGPINSVGLRAVAVANIIIGILFMLWGLVNI